LKTSEISGKLLILIPKLLNYSQNSQKFLKNLEISYKLLKIINTPENSETCDSKTFEKFLRLLKIHEKFSETSEILPKLLKITN
jgi:hypothetical protein